MTDRAFRTQTLKLRARPEPWRMPARQRADVDRHWAESLAANPRLFNGVVHVLTELTLDPEHSGAVLAPAEFKDFLFWRRNAMPLSGIRDVFGAAIVRAADGGVLLVRAAAGTLCAGQTTFVTGFIDANDLRADGTLDLDASTRRELLEETGLGPAELQPEPGVVVAEAGPMVSLGKVYRSKLSAQALQARVTAFVRAQTAPELDGVAMLSHRSELDRLPHSAATRLTLDAVLASPSHPHCQQTSRER